MYCFSCGAKIDDDALICPKCGDRTDHYHQEKATQQDPWATTPQYASATPQYAASTTPAYTAPQQYAQSMPQHYASPVAGGTSTLQGPSLDSSSQLNVADYNAYRRRMEIRHDGKSKRVALVLCIFLGFFGIHRFYLGKIGTGFIWLLRQAFASSDGSLISAPSLAVL